MNTQIRPAQAFDILFMQEMLYEAVYWRENPNKPTYDEALAMPEMSKVLAQWGKRKWDTGVLAYRGSDPAGAAWFRLWTDKNHINGYLDAKTPVIVIAVHEAHRRVGVGGRLLDALILSAKQQNIPQLSLSVTTDNHALHLYQQKGFKQVKQTDDMLMMIRRL
jgi:ribosomal protein S18 acetylase RimI-like enzyme